MKRSGFLARKPFRAKPGSGSLSRSGRPQRKTAMKASNPARQAKRAKAYKSYLSSAVWKAKRKDALERAGHRCEVVENGARCEATTELTVHHETYARFGGNELPDDLKVECRTHHNRTEAAKPHKAGRPFTNRRLA